MKLNPSKGGIYRTRNGSLVILYGMVCDTDKSKICGKIHDYEFSTIIEGNWLHDGRYLGEYQDHRWDIVKKIDPRLERNAMEITKVKIFSPTGQEIIFDKTTDSKIKKIFFEDDVLGIDFVNDEDPNVVGSTVTFEKVPLEITYGKVEPKFKELDFEKLIKEDFKELKSSKDPNNTPKYYRIPCPYCGNYEVIAGREPYIIKDEITLFCKCPQCGERWSQTYEYAFRGEYDV